MLASTVTGCAMDLSTCRPSFLSPRWKQVSQGEDGVTVESSPESFSIVNVGIYWIYTIAPSIPMLIKTRIFQSGNSLAVRIPKELGFAQIAQEVEIERVGDSLIVRPVQSESLGELAQVFAMFTADFMEGGREPAPEIDRNWPEPAGVKCKAKGVVAP